MLTQTKEQITIKEAIKLAHELIELFSYFTGKDNIKVSGSLRRKYPYRNQGGVTVGDIEIVAIDESKVLHNFLKRCIDNPASNFKLRFKNGKKIGFGERAKYLLYKNYALDIFTPKKEAFITTHFIRTGSKEFVKSVMQRCKYLSIQFKFAEGYFLIGGKQIDIRKEEEIFNYLNIPFVDAHARKGFNYKM